MMPRRTFLAVCAAAPLTAGCAAGLRLQGGVDGNRLVVSRRQLGDRAFALVDAPGQRHPIFLRRLSSTEFSAVSTECKHRGCQVEPEADRLVCPCHGSEYSNIGEVLKGPTEHPLTRFSVAVDAERIYITLPPQTP